MATLDIQRRQQRLQKLKRRFKTHTLTTSIPYVYSGYEETNFSNEALMMFIFFCRIFMVGSFPCPQSTTTFFTLGIQVDRIALVLYHEKGSSFSTSSKVSYPHRNLYNISKHLQPTKLDGRTLHGLCLAVPGSNLD